MAFLEVGKPVVTKEPFLVIDPGLPAGEYLFQLEVMTEDRRASAPAQLTVQVIRKLFEEEFLRTGTLTRT